MSTRGHCGCIIRKSHVHEINSPFCVLLFRLEKFYAANISRLQCTYNRSLLRLTMELETGGNVRFNDGTLNDPWYLSTDYNK